MASICDLNNKKPKIDYPTHWEYKVIFDASDEAEAKVKDIVKDREFKLVFSKFSKDKKYTSYDLTVLVLSEEERLEIFSALKHEAKYVL
ncbi:HP0495 family protein [Campylobacter concisus]